MTRLITLGIVTAGGMLTCAALTYYVSWVFVAGIPGTALTVGVLAGALARREDK